MYSAIEEELNIKIKLINTQMTSTIAKYKRTNDFTQFELDNKQINDELLRLLQLAKECYTIFLYQHNNQHLIRSLYNLFPAGSYPDELYAACQYITSSKELQQDTKYYINQIRYDIVNTFDTLNHETDELLDIIFDNKTADIEEKLKSIKKGDAELSEKIDAAINPTVAFFISTSHSLSITI